MTGHSLFSFCFSSITLSQFFSPPSVLSPLLDIHPFKKCWLATYYVQAYAKLREHKEEKKLPVPSSHENGGNNVVHV